MRPLLPALILLALGACRPGAPGGPVVASIIGSSPASAGRIGLVRFDSEGRIVPALALRWAILDGGKDYLFRIDDAPGRPPAAVVARMLRRALKARRRVDAVPAIVASVQAVTATVMEVRLSTRQPDLLILLAMPELALTADGSARTSPAAEDAVMLSHQPDTAPAAPVVVHFERVGRAVARFRAGAAQFVTGGTFADLPVAQVAGLEDAAIRFDPVDGLFGFAPVEGSAFAEPAILRALALALDRERLVAAIDAPGLTTVDRIGPPGAEAPLADRIAEARALLADGGRSLPPLRVAIPGGPGARLLFALAARDWRRIGIGAVAVPHDSPADLVLVDRVVPPNSVPLLACAVRAGCDPRDPAAVAAPLFVAITTPVRWSLVAPALEGFRPNALAAHPLGAMRRLH